jgi:hypothetical protein
MPSSAWSGWPGLILMDGGANLLRYDAGMDKFSAVAVATIAATGWIVLMWSGFRPDHVGEW